jgi:hypothetical protein
VLTIVREVELPHLPVEPFPSKVEVAIARHTPGDRVIEPVEYRVRVDVRERAKVFRVFRYRHGGSLGRRRYDRSIV